ncbi:polysaccharide pyruvyl transferase family protein [Rossellomorea marisflavi]|uniref:polysaccharide pyruvyl transferase family protein n=1 Tax=Rossellomorea marisflavi TaxID=189381 RepID=UPI003457D66C
MNIVFISFIDSTNIGDLLIAEVIEKELFQTHTVEKFSFNLIPEAKIKNNNKDILDRSLKKSNKCKNLLKSLYLARFRNLAIIDKAHTINVKRVLDNNPYLKDLEDAIANCDFLVIGGGNAIFDLTDHSQSSYKFTKIVNLAIQHQKKYFVTSIGVGPFKTNLQLNSALNILSGAEKVTVRDKKSYELLKPLGDKVRLSIDPVFLLNSNNKRVNTSSHKTISICIINLYLNKDNKEKYDKYIYDTVLFVRKLREENYNVNLFSTEPRDYKSVKEVYDHFHDKEVKLVKVYDKETLLNLYRKTDLIVGARMHSLIIGLSQEIPVIGLSWQDKVSEMFKIIDAKNDVIEIHELGDNIERILIEIRHKLDKSNTIDKLKKLKTQNHEKFSINKIIFSEIEEDVRNEQS